MNPQKIREKQAAEQATGITENVLGLGKLYDSSGTPISVEQAIKEIEQRKCIEIPNAGSGSYSRVFEMLGFDRVEVKDWTSSAGDWSFRVRRNDVWYNAHQENRYPYLGFKYYVDLK